MMTLYPKLILDALATVRYPGTGKNLVEAEMVADNLRIDGMSVSFSLIFEKPTDPFMKSMIKTEKRLFRTASFHPKNIFQIISSFPQCASALAPHYASQSASQHFQPTL